MKSSFWKWGFPEHQLLEKSFQNLKIRLLDSWKIESTDPQPNHHFSVIPEISDKQKNAVRDIFAHISIKRVSFQNEKRVYFSLGKYWTKYSLIENEIKIADVILYPIQAKEIQDILNQAQEFDISIRTFNQWNVEPILQFPKTKILGIVNVELMQKIINFDSEKFQVTIQAGTKLYDLQKYLNEEGWELDFEIMGKEHLNILELLQNHTNIQSSVAQIQLHTPSGILIANTKNGFLQQYFENFSLGIPSEIILKTQPKPNYLRRIEAQLKDIHDIKILLQQIDHNKIIIKNLSVIDSSKNTLVNTLEFLKKSEEILFKDETKRPIYISLELEEYHFSISSLLLKVKDMILQLDGKLTSNFLKDKIDEWRKSYPYFENNASENQIDCFHYSTLIPIDKMEDYDAAIRKKLEKNIYYPSKKTNYLLLFTCENSKIAEIDFYFFGSSVHQKTEDSFFQLSEYFKKLLSPGKLEYYQADKTITINEQLKNNFKYFTDPKGILSYKNAIPTTFFTKKN